MIKFIGIHGVILNILSCQNPSYSCWRHCCFSWTYTHVLYFTYALLVFNLSYQWGWVKRWRSLESRARSLHITLLTFTALLCYGTQKMHMSLTKSQMIFCILAWSPFQDSKMIFIMHPLGKWKPFSWAIWQYPLLTHHSSCCHIWLACLTGVMRSIFISCSFVQPVPDDKITVIRVGICSPCRLQRNSITEQNGVLVVKYHLHNLH